MKTVALMVLSTLTIAGCSVYDDDGSVFGDDPSSPPFVDVRAKLCPNITSKLTLHFTPKDSVGQPCGYHAPVVVDPTNLSNLTTRCLRGSQEAYTIENGCRLVVDLENCAEDGEKTLVVSKHGVIDLYPFCVTTTFPDMNGSVTGRTSTSCFDGTGTMTVTARTQFSACSSEYSVTAYGLAPEAGQDAGDARADGDAGTE